MRPSPRTVAVLLAGTLALAGCGGADEERADATAPTEPAVAVPPTTAPAPVTPTEAARETVVEPPPTTVAPKGTAVSGGTRPPIATVTAEAPPTVDGDVPDIALRADGTARATAVDVGQAEIWCDAARQGSYDARLGDATVLVIAVAGSDAATRCALPR